MENNEKERVITHLMKAHRRVCAMQQQEKDLIDKMTTRELFGMKGATAIENESHLKEILGAIELAITGLNRLR